MKRLLFLVSHLGSGWEEVYKSLDANSRIQMTNSNISYNHLSDLDQIPKHKLDNTAAIYGDSLLFNHSFNFPLLYDHCKFIYLIRDASSLDSLVGSGVYDSHYAFMYYTFRLRRICEMAKRTPGSVLLTWNSMKSGLKLVEDYLSLKEELIVPAEIKVMDIVGRDVKRKVQENYERHLYYLRQLPLKFAL